MPSPEITIATTADRNRVVDAVVAAFTHDPVLRYLFPDDPLYALGAPAFFGHLFDERVRHRSIWTINGGAATAIWAPPAGADAVAAPVSTDSGGAERDGLAAVVPADALARVRAYDAAIHAALPTTPFWYLGVLGTHPQFAGRGWGRAVMRAGLRRAADDGLPAVLETGNPANVGFYRDAGWEVAGAVPDPVPTWIMRQSF